MPCPNMNDGEKCLSFIGVANGAVVLLVIYAKNVQENIPAHILKKIAEELGYASY